MKRIMVTVLLLCLALAQFTGAADEGVIEVTATGIGVDSNAALKNAYKSAVEQAVGSLVDSKTMVENDEIISDKILSHSGGFVERYDMLGEPETGEGLVTVKIKAQVKRTRLIGSITAEGMILKESVGDNLNAAVVTKAAESQSADEMFRRLWDGFPDGYLDAKFISGEPVKSGKEFEVKVEISIDEERLKAFDKQVMEVLGKISPEPPETLRFKIVWDRGMMTHAGDDKFEPKSGTYGVCVRNLINADNTLVQYKRYAVTKEMMQYFNNEINKKRPVVRVAIIDNLGSVLKQKVFEIPQPYWLQRNNNLVLAPYLFMAEKCNPVYNWHVPGTVTPTYSYSFDDLFEEEIAEIATVKVTLEKSGAKAK